MSEDREYGLDDGYHDGLRGSTPNPTNGGEVTTDSEYAEAYMEGYRVGERERHEAQDA